MEVLWQLWVTLQVSSCKVQTTIRGGYTLNMYYCSFNFAWHSTCVLMFSGWLFWHIHKTTSCFLCFMNTKTLSKWENNIARYTHAHHVPHVEHMKSCWSDEMAKRGRDDVWSRPAAMLCCSSLCWVKWITQVLTHKMSPVTAILSSFISLLSS